MTLLWLLPAMVGLLAMKAFFSGSETALVSADRNVLGYRARQGSRGARVALALLRNPERILATTLIGTNLATVALTTLGTLMIVRWLGDDMGEIWAVLILTPVLLVLGEIVPKSVFQQEADAIAPVAILPLRVISWLLLPLVLVFASVARLAARVVGGRRSASHLFPARDQLRHVMEVAERASETQVFDRFRIERAIRFAETTVGEVMIPAGEIVGLESSASMDEAIALARRYGHQRLPVFEGHRGNILGVAILTPWDLLDPATRDLRLEDMVRETGYFSPLQPLDEARRVLAERPDGMGIVVDEFGSAVGMITLQDVMSAVVGEIESGLEYDGSSQRWQPGWDVLEGDAYLLDGRLPISQLDDLLGIDLSSGEFHTVGGMIQSRLRHLAQVGESFVEEGFRFTIEQATERAVTKVKVTRDDS